MGSRVGVRTAVCAAGLALALGAHAQEAGPTEPLSCVREELLIGGQRAPIVGAEDLAFDPASGLLFLSAFDRRAVLQAIKDRQPPPQGVLIVAERTELGWAARSVAASVSDGGPADQFRPHGIALAPQGGRLAVINRRYQGGRRDVAIEIFAVAGATLTHETTLTHPAFCRANDLAFASPAVLLVTVDHGACADWAAAVEDIFGLKRSGVLVVPVSQERWSAVPPRMARVGRGLGFANGIVWSDADDGAWVAATREKRVYFVPRERLSRSEAGSEEPREVGFVTTPGHPDNLSFAVDGTLLAALHPHLIRLALHRSDPENAAGSRVARIDADGVTTVLEDDAGLIFSAATVAVEADGALVLGSATDTGLLVCEGLAP